MFNRDVFIKYFLIFITLSVTIGCNSNDETMEKRNKLTYFKDANNYAGYVISSPPITSDKAGVASNYEAWIFGRIFGKSFNVMMPSLPYTVFISSANNVIAPTIDGIVSISEGKKIKWLYKEDKTLLLASWAVNDSRDKIIFTIIEVPTSRYFLVTFDVLAGRWKKQLIPERPLSLLFVSKKKGMALVGNKMITINYAESKEPYFSITQKDASYDKRICAILNGNYVFYSEVCENQKNEKCQYILYYNNHEIKFDQYLLFVSSGGPELWALSRDGRVYEVKNNGKKYLIDKIDVEIIGYGYDNLKLWIATQNGSIRIYDHKLRWTIVNLEDISK